MAKHDGARNDIKNITSTKDSTFTTDRDIFPFVFFVLFPYIYKLQIFELEWDRIKCGGFFITLIMSA